MLHSITFRFLEIILLEFLNIDNWTNLFTQSAICAFILINLRIPKALYISLECYSIMGTYITTSIATATLGLICYINHNRRQTSQDS